MKSQKKLSFFCSIFGYIVVTPLNKLRKKQFIIRDLFLPFIISLANFFSFFFRISRLLVNFSLVIYIYMYFIRRITLIQTIYIERYRCFIRLLRVNTNFHSQSREKIDKMEKIKK